MKRTLGRELNKYVKPSCGKAFRTLHTLRWFATVGVGRPCRPIALAANEPLSLLRGLRCLIRLVDKSNQCLAVVCDACSAAESSVPGSHWVPVEVVVACRTDVHTDTNPATKGLNAPVLILRDDVQSVQLKSYTGKLQRRWISHLQPTTVWVQRL